MGRPDPASADAFIPAPAVPGGRSTPVGGTLCSTAGATSVTFQADEDDRYYLVAPTSGSTEGSYGLDGNDLERPASPTACADRSLGTCP